MSHLKDTGSVMTHDMWGKRTCPQASNRSGDTHTAVTADTGIRDSEHSIVTRAH